MKNQNRPKNREQSGGDEAGENREHETRRPAKRGICCVAGAGERAGRIPKPGPGDFVIAADGGFGYLKEQGITPDMVLGDFDSLDERDFLDQGPDRLEVVELSPVKDDTDMMAALKAGMKRGYRLFHIYGGMGGRLDHTVANLQSLAWLSEGGARGVLFGHGTAATAVTDGSIEFGEECAGYISVFSVSDVSQGVCLRGLKYELTDADLDNRFPLGVSNEFTGKKSRVSVRRGTLLILYTLPPK